VSKYSDRKPRDCLFVLAGKMQARGNLSAAEFTKKLWHRAKEVDAGVPRRFYMLCPPTPPGRRAAERTPCRRFQLANPGRINRSSGLAGVGECGVGQPFVGKSRADQMRPFFCPECGASYKDATCELIPVRWSYAEARIF
jgi:hypothetical protein